MGASAAGNTHAYRMDNAMTAGPEPRHPGPAFRLLQTLRTSVWLHLLLAVALCLLLFLLEWPRWPDARVDFGLQCYTPWQLAQGSVLYRDVTILYGPFSSYFNAALFYLFGPSIHLLFFANLFWFIALLLMLYRFIALLATRAIACIGCIPVIVACGFSQHIGVSNYQFIAPYSHELTHGFILAVASLLAFRKYLATASLRMLALSGLLAGITLLTKPEPAFALFVALATGLLLLACKSRFSRPILRACLLFAIAAALPVLIATCLFAFAVSWPDALRSSLGAWAAASNPALRNIPLYRDWMGLADFPNSLLQILLCIGWYLLILSVFLGAALLCRKIRPPLLRCLLMLITSAAILLIVSLLFGKDYWQETARAFPLLVLGALLLQVRSMWKKSALDGPDLTLTVSLVFALVMLARMIFNVRLYHFGFVLALPALLALVVLFGHFLPRWIDARRPGAGHLLRLAMGLWVATFLILWQAKTFFYLHAKTLVVGQSADQFRYYPFASPIADAVAFLQNNTAPSDTIAVFPEGAMINYLTRRRMPTRFVQFMPSEIAAYGEADIVRAFNQHPPDVIVLVHRDTSEYGSRYFGSDYAPLLGRWLQTYYSGGKVFGALPFNAENRFGVVAFHRNARPIQPDPFAPGPSAPESATLQSPASPLPPPLPPPSTAR
jgi:hypothetical protein